jgi:hypothetical protein
MAAGEQRNNIYMSSSQKLTLSNSAKEQKSKASFYTSALHVLCVPSPAD